MKRAPIARSLALLLSAACASAPPPAGPAPEPPVPAPSPPAPEVAPLPPEALETPVARGELPWWHNLPPGLYRWDDRNVVLAVGVSSRHHHSAEGFLRAKVTARLGVRKASEPVVFSGEIPEPSMVDLFVTRERKRFFALYRIDVPESARLLREAPPLEVPPVLRRPGRRRVGRHVFEDAQHQFLECEVEGPIANPDWGRSRAAARP